jgi:hypothetical protein
MVFLKTLPGQKLASPASFVCTNAESRKAAWVSADFVEWKAAP